MQDRTESTGKRRVRGDQRVSEKSERQNKIEWGELCNIENKISETEQKSKEDQRDRTKE